MSYNGVLRTARDELAPLIPELAQDLSFDEYAISNALYAAVLNQQGTRVQEILEVDWAKTEQQAIVAWGSGKIRETLIEGEGREARYRTGMLPSSTQNESSSTEPLNQWFQATKLALSSGATGLLTSYTSEDNPEGIKIIPDLTRRYEQLGNRRDEILRMQNPGSQGGLPSPSLYLSPALRNDMVTIDTLPHLRFINEHVQGSPAEKLAAAHDTTYIPYSLSAHNARHDVYSTSLDLRDALQGASVVQDSDSGRYTVWGADGQRLRLPRDPSDLPEATLKCPARIDGNLLALIGATINAAGETFGVFD